MDSKIESYSGYIDNPWAKDFDELLHKSVDASALDRKTHQLALIAVLSATSAFGGLERHVKYAKSIGISREEVESAVLVSLSQVGVPLAESYKVAMYAYDEVQGVGIRS